MFQKYVVPAIGLTAFVIGGLVARDKAIEAVEVVKKSLSD